MPNVNCRMTRNAECVEKLIELRSITAVRMWYIEKYGIPASSANSLRSWLQLFRERGKMADRTRSGCPYTSTNEVRRIETLFISDPRVPIRNAGRELNIPESTIQRILRAILSMFPYRISLLQQVLPNDYQKRLEFAQHYRREMRNDAGYMNRIVFSDECLFHTSRKWTSTTREHGEQRMLERYKKFHKGLKRLRFGVECMNQGS